MTPQEKAIALINRYNLFVFDIELGKSNSRVKECALIAVNEIINSNPHSNPFNTNVFSTMDYWLEVKKEIDKL